MNSTKTAHISDNEGALSVAIEILTTESIPLLSYWDLSDKQQEEQSEIFGDENAMDGNFFEFQGNLYALADCVREEMHTEAGENGWHGYFSETAFSRLLVRLVDDNEAVILGRES